jgi:uncharacterized protein (TIGR02145 family)
MKKYLQLAILIFVTCSTTSSQQYGSFKDSRDGRVYKTVKIGEQVWMAENLNTDRFRNGDPIPEAKTPEEWEAAGENQQPAWCYYENNPANGLKYGKLYNWYAVNDYRGLAPEGYHIATQTEFESLKKYLGKNAGNKLKSKSGWNSYTTGGRINCPNCEDWNNEYRKKVPCHICRDTRFTQLPKVNHPGNGTNMVGFSGLPGGYRLHKLFVALGYKASWWTSSKIYKYSAGISYSLSNDDSELDDRKFSLESDGHYIRCIKD